MGPHAPHPTDFRGHCVYRVQNRSTEMEEAWVKKLS